MRLCVHDPVAWQSAHSDGSLLGLIRWRDEDGAGTPSSVTLNKVPLICEAPLELVVRDFQGVSAMEVLSTSRTVEVSVQSTSDTSPSYAFTSRGQPESGAFATALNLQSFCDLSLVRLRLLSLKQPGVCIIHRVTLSRKGDSLGAETAQEAGGATAGEPAAAVAAVAAAASDTSTGGCLLAVATASSTGSPSDSLPSDLPAAAGTDRGAGGASLGTGEPECVKAEVLVPTRSHGSASQSEQIRMLLQHALKAKGPTGELPASLNELRARVEAPGGRGSSLHTLASSLARMALAPAPPPQPTGTAMTPQKVHPAPGEVEEAQFGTEAWRDLTSGASHTAEAAAAARGFELTPAGVRLGSGTSCEIAGAPSADSAPVVAAAPVEPLGGVVGALLAQLHVGIGRVEGLERSMQAQLGALERLVSSAASLQGRLEQGLSRLDVALARLEPGGACALAVVDMRSGK